MIKRTGWAVLWIFMCICGVARTETPAPLAADIAELVKQLASDDFDVRDAAGKKLKTFGDVIAPQLRALRDRAEDPESKKRLEQIVALWPDGGTAWEFEAGYVFGLPVVSGDRVYVGNKDTQFYCLDANSGKVIWSVPVGGHMFHSVALADGRLYLIRTRKDGHKDGTLFCLDTATGKELWNYHGRDSQTFTPPLVTGGKLYLGCEEMLFCFDAADGKVLWRHETPDIILSALSLADGRIVLGNLDQNLYCVDAEKGKLLWQFQTGGPVYAGGALSGGRVYAGSNDQTLYCLNAEDGKRIWEFKTQGSIAASPAVTNDRVYVGSDEGMLYCLNLQGEKVWNFETGGNMYCSPAVSQGNVYTVGLNNKLTMFCLNAADGKSRWTFETREAGYAHPILCGRRMYVGYHSTFFVLRTGTEGPHEWTMMGGNPGRTNFYEVAR